jgi:hypothetical protein
MKGRIPGFLTLLLVGGVSTVQAQVPLIAESANEASTTAVAATGVRTQAARVGWLDKQTNRRADVVLPLNQPQTLGGLQLVLKRCVPNLQGRVGLDTAWLEVTDPARSTPWFAGWMFNQFPDVATLDHPRYNLQLNGCGATAPAPVRAVRRAPAATPVADVAVPDLESGSSLTESAAQEFVVPGVPDVSTPPAPEPAPQTAAPEALPVEEAPAQPDLLPAEAPTTLPTEAGDALQQLIDQQSLPQGQ